LLCRTWPEQVLRRYTAMLGTSRGPTMSRDTLGVFREILEPIPSRLGVERTIGSIAERGGRRAQAPHPEKR